MTWAHEFAPSFTDPKTCAICATSIQNLAEQYRKTLVEFEEQFLLARRTSKTDRHAEAMAMSITQGAHIVAEARLKAALRQS